MSVQSRRNPQEQSSTTIRQFTSVRPPPPRPRPPPTHQTEKRSPVSDDTDDDDVFMDKAVKGLLSLDRGLESEHDNSDGDAVPDRDDGVGEVGDDNNGDITEQDNVRDDDLSFQDWIAKNAASQQKIHHLPDDRYNLLMECVRDPQYLKKNRHKIDSTVLSWATNQLTRHTYRIRHVLDNPTPGDTTFATTAVLTEEVIDKKTKEAIYLRAVRASEVEHHLRLLHQEVGHKGDASMWAIMRHRFCFIPRTWMRAYIRRCQICEKRRGKQNAKPRVAITHKRIFETHAIDFIDYSHSPDGEFKYVLHLVDHVSKMHWTICTRTKEAAEVVSFLESVWSITGPPAKLQSDNGGEFVAGIVEDLCHEMNVSICRSPAYDPAANGCIERANQTLERLIAAFNDVNGTTGFVKAAYKCTMIHNTTYHRSINTSPYEFVFSFKPPNRSFTYVPIPELELEPYSTASSRLKSHSRRPYTPVTEDNAVAEVTSNAMTTEMKNKANEMRNETTNESAAVSHDWMDDPDFADPPRFDLSQASSKNTDDSDPFEPPATESQSKSELTRQPAQPFRDLLLQNAPTPAILSSSKPTKLQQPLSSSRADPSMSQPTPSNFSTAPSSVPPASQSSSSSTQSSSETSSSATSTTPSSTESAQIPVSTVEKTDISDEDLQMLEPGMSGSIGSHLARDLNVNGCTFCLVGTIPRGRCAFSAVMQSYLKRSVSIAELDKHRQRLAKKLLEEWTEEQYRETVAFDGKHGADSLQGFIDDLKNLDRHLGIELFRVLSVVLQINIYIISVMVTRTTEESGREVVEVVTTCELAVQQENVENSIAVHHQFTRVVNKQNMIVTTLTDNSVRIQPNEVSTGHYQSLAHRDESTTMTYKWSHDQPPMTALQRFLQRSATHRHYEHRAALLQNQLNKYRNNVVQFSVGDVVGVLLDGPLRKRLKKVNKNAVFNIPGVVCKISTSKNGIRNYFVMVRSGAVINEPIGVDALRTTVGEKSNFKKVPVRSWMTAERVTLAQAYSLEYPTPGPSYATVLDEAASVRDQTPTVEVDRFLVSKKSVPKPKQSSSINSNKQTSIKGLKTKSKTIPNKSTSLKSSAQIKKRPAAPVEISPPRQYQKRQRVDTVSPIPIPADAIRFRNRSGVQEIVRIVKESKPDAKHRSFKVQWYNEYGGEVTDKWEPEGAPFWSKEPSYGELLRQWINARPENRPPRTESSPIVIDED